ncbi:MAG TPA: amino acid adenylation domain-containing protein [Anaerohalosphaeraceae bacterium]|nr:amino acid adenylation domain-containing protein [Anaerohalosphaeraceae bacterium]
MIEQEWDRLAQYPTDNPTPCTTPDHLAYIIYTSGSTGTPKGVAIPHRGVMRLVFGQNYLRFGSDRIFLQLVPVGFDASTLEIWGPLLHGGQCVLYPGRIPDLELLSHILSKTHINTLFLTTALFNLIIDENPLMLSNIETVMTGAEAVSITHVQKAVQLMPSVQWVHLYGPTESTTLATSYLIPKSVSPLQKTIPIGKPIANTQVYILDNALQPVAIGVPGELYIGGDGLARGYLNRPELTAERFIPNPFSSQSGDRLYKTGDICRWMQDGNIEFGGRADDQVKIRGFRIELGEIENALRHCPHVHQAVTIIREDVPGQKYIVGYVVLEEAGFILPDQIQQHLARSLPEYMIPSVIVELTRLPLTANGKIDRASLPRTQQHDSKQGHRRLPQTSTEQMIARLWKELLKIGNVYLEDNFFHLGGHSLKAIQTVYSIQKKMGVNLPVSTLFENPTLEQFACVIDHYCSQSNQSGLLILPVSRSQALPLSFAQKRMWFIQQLSPELPVYNISWMMYIKGCLNITALEKSLQEIIRRHESFRTTFPMNNGQPVQSIRSDAAWNLPVETIAPGSLSPIQAFQTIAESRSQRLFNLEQGPLFQFTLLCMKPDDYALLLNMHHLITDGWSMGIFTQELTELYQHYTQNTPVNSASLSVQYADYGCWQQTEIETLKKQDFDYWKQKLAGDIPEVTIPLDFPRSTAYTYLGQWETRHVQDSVYTALKDLSHQKNTTLYTLLLSAFHILLYYYNRSEDITVGSPISGRTHKEIENIIGFFVNTTVLRCSITKDMSFLDVLHQVGQLCLEAQQHQDLPYDVLVELLNPPRQANRNLYFQTMLAYQDSRYWAVNLPNLKCQTIEIGTKTSKIDFTLFCDESHSGLQLRAEYNTALYTNETIRRCLSSYEQILARIIECPEQTILSIISPLTANLVQKANASTKKEYPATQCIHQLFEQQAEKTPDAMAVMFEDQTLTYRQLNEQANQLAHYLRAHGVGPDVPVGVCMDRCIELLPVLLGILKAGGAYVPLDPTYPTERLSFMASDTGLSIVIAHSGLAETLVSDKIKLLLIEQEWDRLAQYPTDNPALCTTPDHLAYIIYTSGSTGTPKGVAVPHRGVVRLVFGQDYMQFGPNRVFLQLAPVSFDASTLEIWGALLHGGQCVLYPGRIPELELLGHILAASQVNALWLTSSLFNMVIDEKPEILSSVRTILTGGEALSVPHVRKAAKLLDSVELVNGYGPTESTTFACCYPIPKPIPDNLKSIPIGRPIANTEVYILDSSLQPVPLGVWGELYIGGDGLARGYLNRPELTAERFIHNPFHAEPNSRLYKTGDICRWMEDGTIEFGGRADDQVKIRGFRIELGEIENALRHCPHVQQAAVIVREDIPGQKYIVGYVVLEEAVSILPDQIQKNLARSLPDYMIPSVIVELTQLPLTANGKIDKIRLPKPQQHDGTDGQQRLPQSSMERILADVWQDMLGIDTVYLDDNFFHLGGHSLLAAKLFYRLEERFQIDLPLGLIFEAPTIRQLADCLRKHRHESISKTLVQIQPGRLKQGIFYLPGVGGHTLNFYHLAHLLTIPLSQYGLNLPGLNGNPTILHTIEEMAAYFIREIQQVQPEGPYWLCGFSMGGRIAYEMALQLTTQGHNVAFLGILGTSAPGFPKAYSWKPAHYLERFWKFCGLSLNEKVRYLQSQRQYKKLRKQRQTAQKDGWNIHEFPNYRKLYQAGLEAFFRYQTRQRYDGDIVLFREMKDFNLLDKEMYNHPTFGWDQFITGQIRVHDIDCIHPNILNQPHVQTCAVLLEKEILETVHQHKLI